MRSEVAIAVAIAGWILSLGIALTVTGAVVPDQRLARATAKRWWYIPPATVGICSGASAILLNGVMPRAMCFGAGLLCVAIFAIARPRETKWHVSARRSAGLHDSHEPLRLVLLAISVTAYTAALFLALLAAQS